jgi:hypothetical protein
MSEKRDEVDWSLTTWEGSRRAQLRHALELTLRERMEALEDLADVARRLAQMRERRAFESAVQAAEATGSVTPSHVR